MSGPAADLDGDLSGRHQAANFAANVDKASATGVRNLDQVAHISGRRPYAG